MPSVADLIRAIASKLDGLSDPVSEADMVPVFDVIKGADPDTELRLLDILVASKDRLCAHRTPTEGAAALRELADELEASDKRHNP